MADMATTAAKNDRVNMVLYASVRSKC